LDGVVEGFDEHYCLSCVNSLLLTGQPLYRRSMALIISKYNYIKYLLELVTEKEGTAASLRRRDVVTLSQI